MYKRQAGLNDGNGDESWGMDNFVVKQSPGERYGQMGFVTNNVSQWNDMPSTTTTQTLPGVVELTVPDISWASGEPNDGGVDGTNRNQENYLGMYGSLGTFLDVQNDATRYLSQAAPVWGPSRDIRESFYDYKYDWTSVALDVTDPRFNYRYNTTSTVTPIYETQPLYHQEDVTTVSTVSRLTPRRVNQTVYQTQSVTTCLLYTSPSPRD